MPEVLFNNDDVTVLGSPESIDLLLDIGPQGIRGNRFFTGTFIPTNQTSIGGISVQLGDFYLNISPASNGYSYLYEYVSQPGGNVWIPSIKVNPTLYSAQASVTFASGTGTHTINIANIAPGTSGLTASNFNVQYSILDASNRPIASSIELSVASNILTITLTAAKYESSAWANLSGDFTVQFFVSVI